MKAIINNLTIGCNLVDDRDGTRVVVRRDEWTMACTNGKVPRFSLVGNEIRLSIGPIKVREQISGELAAAIMATIERDGISGAIARPEVSDSLWVFVTTAEKAGYLKVVEYNAFFCD